MTTDNEELVNKLNAKLFNESEYESIKSLLAKIYVELIDLNFNLKMKGEVDKNESRSVFKGEGETDGVPRPNPRDENTR